MRRLTLLWALVFALGYTVAQQARIAPHADQEAFPIQRELVEPEVAAQASQTTPPTNPSPYAVGAKTVGNVTATKVGEGPNAFGGFSTSVNQVTHLSSLDYMAVIFRQNNNECGGQSGQYRYSYSTDLGQTWFDNTSGASSCFGFGTLNPTHFQAGRYPSMFAFLPSGQSTLSDIRMAYGGWSHNGVGSNTNVVWTGNVTGVVNDPTNFVNPSTNVSQEAYPMYQQGGIDYGSTNMVERIPGEYWIPLVNRDPGSNNLGNIDLWKGVYDATGDTLAWSLATVIDPDHATPNDPTVGSPNMAFSPDGQSGVLIWTGDLASTNPGGVDSSSSIIYTRTLDGGATWDTPDEFDLLNYPALTDSLQSLLFINAAGDTVPFSTGAGTVSFTSDVVVDANGIPHVIARVATAQRNEDDGSVSPLGNFIYPGLPKFLLDFTIDPSGEWNGIFLSPIACWTGDFLSTPGDPISVDVWCQASRSADGTKIFFSWTDTDTTGIGGSENINPDLFGRMLDVNTMQLSPIIDWTDGDPNWDGEVLLPTVDPVALDDGANLFTVPTMVSEFTDAGQTTGYWYFSDIQYDASTATIPVNWASNCFQSTLADAPNVVEPTCGGSDGVINPNITGGVAPFAYSWNTGATSASLTGLNPGSYSYVVTDAEGCTVSGEVLLESASPITATPQVISDISCAGLTDGSAALEMADGTAPYSFAWANGETDSIATQLPAGTTTVEVTDAAGCVTFAEVAVSEPAALVVDNITDGTVTCAGDSDGEVSAAASGGTGNLTYSWDNGATGATISGLAAGTYEVTVTDENGCTVSQNAAVDEPAALEPLVTSFPSTSPNSGSITIDPAGQPGNGPDYTYTITLAEVLGFPPANPFDTTFVSSAVVGESIIGLCGGTYRVLVEDAKGCTFTDSINVEASPNAFCAQAATAIEEVNGLKRFNVYPNPTQGLLQVELELVETDDLLIEVLNTQGESVATRQVSKVPNYQTTFDLSHATGGMYLLRVTTSQGTQSTKVMLR